jgi:Rrf2 family protein
MSDLQAKVRYAVRAALYLAENYRGEEPIKVHEIAAATDVPPKYLVHILLSLKRRALANSTRGPAGGYWLLRRPGLITLWEVVDAVENEDSDGEEELTSEVSYDRTINRVWRQLEDRRREFLSGFTLADLIGSE